MFINSNCEIRHSYSVKNTSCFDNYCNIEKPEGSQFPTASLAMHSRNFPEWKRGMGDEF